MFRSKQKTPAVVDREPYDWAKESDLIESGDFEEWLDHIMGRPLSGYSFGARDVAVIAYNAARIAIRNEREGTAELK
jgi:hypothetical protein